MVSRRALLNMQMYALNSVLFDDSLLVAGDFNCDVNSRFYDMFAQFCYDKI